MPPSSSAAPPTTATLDRPAEPTSDLRTLIDGFDWRATPLGPADTWSPIRRRTIDLMLGSRTAIATMWGPSGVLIYNDACATLAGQLHPGILGQPAEMSSPRSGAFGRALLDQVRAGETLVLHNQKLMTERNGVEEDIWLDLCYTPILDKTGAVDGVFAIITETTVEVLEREDVETALRQSQKMEAIGQLTGGIAHDFNNLLTGIMGNLDMLATRLTQGRIDSGVSYLQGARSAATRAAGLTQRLLAFSRRQSLSPDVIPVPALLEDMNELIGRTVGAAIDVSVSWQPDIWDGFCDRNQLENALLNLAINARDAMPEGGTLTIDAANATLGPPGRTQSYAPGDYVVLAITDTGAGMSQEVIDRAFEPFFTTKLTGQGTGLGLSMVYGFIKQSEGHIELASQPGSGTTIRLYIPRHDTVEDAEPAAEPAPATETPAARREETIIIVEYAADLRALLVNMLVEQGFHVLGAADVDTGLDIIRSDARIDLLITDIGLPGGMNGTQFAEAARCDRPDLPVLFVTGLTNDTPCTFADQGAAFAMLRKPFSLVTLEEQVNLLLTRARKD